VVEQVVLQVTVVVLLELLALHLPVARVEQVPRHQVAEAVVATLAEAVVAAITM
jgi:hypothetical protein